MKKITFGLLMLLPVLTFAQDEYGGAVEAMEHRGSRSRSSSTAVEWLFCIAFFGVLIYLQSDKYNQRKK